MVINTGSDANEGAIDSLLEPWIEANIRKASPANSDPFEVTEHCRRFFVDGQCFLRTVIRLDLTFTLRIYIRTNLIMRQ